MFRGLPDGYDYYGACTRGACVAAPHTLRFDIAPGEKRVLARVVVEPSGAGPCSGPLAPGRHSVGIELPGQPAHCADPPVSLDVPSPQPSGPRAPERESEEKRRCPPMPACGIGCTGPMARDDNGCPLCACEDLGVEITAPREPR